MRIRFNANVNAPCCPGEIQPVRASVVDELGLSHREAREFVESASILVQSDWDFPGVASSFGWAISDAQTCPRCGADDYVMLDDDVRRCNKCRKKAEDCPHVSTDGTVDCPDCHMTAGQFIDQARQYLEDEADGMVIDDPGYFS